MELIKTGAAGTLESSDINIVINPSNNPGIEISLQSAVIKQFGKQIKETIEDTIRSKGVNNAIVKAVDKGAVDFVIKARTLTALYRAAEIDEHNWEE